MQYVLLTIAMMVSTFYGYSQNKNYFIGPELGIISVLSEIPHMDFIRGDIPSPSSYSVGSIKSQCTQAFAGFKIENFIFHEKLALSAGINYQYSNTSFGKINEWKVNNDYFYWQIENEGLSTQYYRVRGVEQNNSYIGIPLEIRYFISQPKIFRLYGKFGLNLNLLINSESDISFKTSDMEKYSEKMIAMLEKPNTFYSSVHLAGGIRIGKQGHTCTNLEVQMPYFFINQPGGITNTVTGVGFEFSVLFPLKTIEE